ncbi:MAG: hypothetical protein FWD29_03860 [Micrococcales bacterium]|nr:hypothetical protein [Micrococcales bacterium]
MSNRADIAAELVWPQMQWPGVPSVYLDINHFIYMARSRAGNPNVPTENAHLLTALERAVDNHQVVVPLSLQHLWEINKSKNPQRARVAALMERLSGLQYILGPKPLAQLEIASGVAAIAGEPPPSWQIPLVGFGSGQAYGIKIAFKVQDSGCENVTDAVRKLVGSAELDSLFLDGRMQFEQIMLRGPTDAQDADLRANYGYRPESVDVGMDSRLAWEVESVSILDKNPELRAGRLRDFVTGREVIGEWVDLINRHLLERVSDGLSWVDMTPDRWIALITAMPHVQVAISVKTAYHKDPRRSWKVNDVFDIDALSTAFAYCDAVMTDNALRHALQSRQDIHSFGTHLAGTPAELTAWLAHPTFRSDGVTRGDCA